MAAKTGINAVSDARSSYKGAQTPVKKRDVFAGRQYESQLGVCTYYNDVDRVSRWGKLGAIWGGAWGLLFGPAFFFLPDLAPAILGGPILIWMVAILDNALISGAAAMLCAGVYNRGLVNQSIAIKTGSGPDKSL